MDRTWILSLSLVLVSFRFNFAQSDSTNDKLREYLKHFNKNRHHVTNPLGKEQARDFIRETFTGFGLHTWTESFFPQPPNVKITKGFNIVGLLPGKLARTRDDRLILIGSHYDTMRSTSQGADDNGSGVVAMLQITRQLTSNSENCPRDYSVMFVAFDFEEWENETFADRACAELGCGSRAFVANFSQHYNLFPNMSVARYGQLQGAIIMDTMMNYNSTPNSQHIAPDQIQKLEKCFPEVVNSIKSNKFRGDFLVAVGRYSDDDHLLSTFSYYYKKKRNSKYKLQVFRLPLGGHVRLPPTSALSAFLRSDHINFWNESTSDRAIFLSDTADMRGYMTKCYHKNCDSLSHVTNDFLGFLAKSCDAVVKTTNDATKAKCQSPPAESSIALPLGGSMAIGVLIGSIISGFCFCFRKKQDHKELVEEQEPNRSATNPVYETEIEPEITENEPRKPSNIYEAARPGSQENRRDVPIA